MPKPRLHLTVNASKDSVEASLRFTRKILWSTVAFVVSVTGAGVKGFLAIHDQLARAETRLEICEKNYRSALQAQAAPPASKPEKQARKEPDSERRTTAETEQLSQR